MSRRALYWTIGVLLALLVAGYLTFEQLATHADHAGADGRLGARLHK